MFPHPYLKALEECQELGTREASRIVSTFYILQNIWVLVKIEVAWVLEPQGQHTSLSPWGEEMTQRFYPAGKVPLNAMKQFPARISIPYLAIFPPVFPLQFGCTGLKLWGTCLQCICPVVELWQLLVPLQHLVHVHPHDVHHLRRHRHLWHSSHGHAGGTHLFTPHPRASHGVWWDSLGSAPKSQPVGTHSVSYTVLDALWGRK